MTPTTDPVYHCPNCGELWTDHRATKSPNLLGYIDIWSPKMADDGLACYSIKEAPYPSEAQFNPPLHGSEEFT